jgi:hypothetical protein
MLGILFYTVKITYVLILTKKWVGFYFGLHFTKSSGQPECVLLVHVSFDYLPITYNTHTVGTAGFGMLVYCQDLY